MGCVHENLERAGYADGSEAGRADQKRAAELLFQGETQLQQNGAWEDLGFVRAPVKQWSAPPPLRSFVVSCASRRFLRIFCSSLGAASPSPVGSCFSGCGSVHVSFAWCNVLHRFLRSFAFVAIA